MEQGARVGCPPGLVAAVMCSILLSGCDPPQIHQQVKGSLRLNSSSLVGGAIPDKYGCKGPGVSPQVSWSDPPPGTQSFTLIMDDLDSTVGHLHRHHSNHWLVFDMPAERRNLPEGVPKQALADSTQQGANDLGQIGYLSPCPSVGDTHHYAITVYALDAKVGLPTTIKAGQLLSAIDGHILARGQIVGTYTR
jgi:Raf kinase inhibitor-like YbhB/YbcL family protein